MKIELTKPLAEAIVQVDNICFDGGLGPQTDEQKKAWDELLLTVEKEYGLTSLYLSAPRGDLNAMEQ